MSLYKYDTPYDIQEKPSIKLAIYFFPSPHALNGDNQCFTTTDWNRCQKAYVCLTHQHTYLSVRLIAIKISVPVSMFTIENDTLPIKVLEKEIPQSKSDRRRWMDITPLFFL